MRRCLFFALILFAFVPACRNSESNRERRGVMSVEPEGMIAETATRRLRIYALRSGVFRVWLMDKTGKPLATENTIVRLKLDTPGYPEVRLEPREGSFQGKGPEVPTDHADATVICEAGGSMESTKLRLHMESGEAAPHRDERR